MGAKLNWDEYFIGVAKLSALRSKDPNTKVGACIVNKRKRIIGVGYNGFPYGCDDEVFPWNNNKEHYFESKYPFVVHAEMNAILNSTMSLEGATLYVTLFPCHECVKSIIQSGIKEIVYCEDKYCGTESDLAGKKMLEAAGIVTRKINDIIIEVKK